MVINGTRVSDGISYYINGVMVNPQRNLRGEDEDRSGTGVLKNDQTFFPAWIDELCFWNRRLDPQEIEDLYNSYGKYYVVYVKSTCWLVTLTLLRDVAKRQFQNMQKNFT